MHKTGPTCGPFPSPEVYTKISKYRPWLDKIIEQIYNNSLKYSQFKRSADPNGANTFSHISIYFCLPTLFIMLLINNKDYGCIFNNDN